MNHRWPSSLDHLLSSHRPLSAWKPVAVRSVFPSESASPVTVVSRARRSTLCGRCLAAAPTECQKSPWNIRIDISSNDGSSSRQSISARNSSRNSGGSNTHRKRKNHQKQQQQTQQQQQQQQHQNQRHRYSRAWRVEITASIPARYFDSDSGPTTAARRSASDDRCWSETKHRTLVLRTNQRSSPARPVRLPIRLHRAKKTNKQSKRPAKKNQNSQQQQKRNRNSATPILLDVDRPTATTSLCGRCCSSLSLSLSFIFQSDDPSLRATELRASIRKEER